MAFKIVCGIAAAALLVVFTGAVVVKLKEVALIVVILIGIAMMLFDLWQSLQSKDD